MGGQRLSGQTADGNDRLGETEEGVDEDDPALSLFFMI